METWKQRVDKWRVDRFQIIVDEVCFTFKWDYNDQSEFCPYPDNWEIDVSVLGECPDKDYAEYTRRQELVERFEAVIDDIHDDDDVKALRHDQRLYPVLVAQKLLSALDIKQEEYYDKEGE